MRRDSEHAHACAVRSAIHLHGVMVHLHVSRPPSTYFELGGLTPANLRYAGVNKESKCFVNTVLASLCYVGVAHMRCATPAQRYAVVRESGPICVFSFILNDTQHTHIQ